MRCLCFVKLILVARAVEMRRERVSFDVGIQGKMVKAGWVLLRNKRKEYARFS